MEKITLELQKRETAGKHNRALRRSGVTPAHLFGHRIESMALEGATTDLEQTLSHAGMSRLINLKVRGERHARSVLVREIQRKPASGLLLHVDLYQVSSKEKMTGEVPVHIVGVAPALVVRSNKVAVEMPTLDVECLPADLPARIDLDVSILKVASDVIRVGDIRPPDGVTILNDHELVVVKIEVERKIIVEAEEKAPEAAATTEGKTSAQSA
jgi:large subunit ribosomal protein L25